MRTTEVKNKIARLERACGKIGENIDCRLYDGSDKKQWHYYKSLSFMSDGKYCTVVFWCLEDWKAGIELEKSYGSLTSKIKELLEPWKDLITIENK